MLRLIPAVSLACIVLLRGDAAAQTSRPARENYYWIEGESAVETNIKPHPWYSEAVRKEQLSGGKWLAHFDGARDGAAQYAFNATAGVYTFWIRANPIASKMSFRLNGAPSRDIDFSGDTDRVNLASDDRPDLRFLAWIRVGNVQLREGRNSLLLRMSSENNHHGAVDCMAFIEGENATWRPGGTLRPGQVAQVSAQARPAPAAAAPVGSGLWIFNAPADTYRPNALLDLSSLNEKVAGETGFIRRTADGNDFVRGDGAPIRFWSVGTAGSDMSDADMEDHCRFLAKRGVNMTRLHLTLCDVKEGAKVTDIDEKKLDGVFKFVAAAKRHGIYVTLSPYWAFAKAPKSWEIEDYDGQQLWGVLFTNPKLQAAYRAWCKEIYTRPNPYTGVALKDEPALAIIQLQNEDSLLFWTFQAMRGRQREIAGKRFATWATAKYGSLEKATDAWSGAKAPDDDLAANRLGFDLIWALTQDVPNNAGKRRRLADQTQFLAETMRDFNRETEAYLRELGCRQLVNAENWRSADPVRLDDAERWSYAANEVIATNYYVGGSHIGDNAGYRIDPGHHFANQTCLKNPTSFPGNLKQVAGHPMIVTECAWALPNLYQSEGPFMLAAYQSLTGIDSTYFFMNTEPQYLNDPRRLFWPVGDSHALMKWSASTPMATAQFPAYALAFRKGYVKPAGKPVVYEERPERDLWERRIPIISESGKFDPNRDEGAFAAESPVKQEVDRLAFLVGPVVVKYGGDPTNNRLEDLSKYIDGAAGTVTSVTREIALNYKQGLMTVNTRKFQGVSGFLKDAGGKFDLADVQLESGNVYATFGAVSLDDQPLTSSKKILLQVGTTARPAGWVSKPASFKADNTTIDGEVIVKTGGPGWQIEETDMLVSLKNPTLTRATRLDLAGNAVGVIDSKRVGDTLQFRLPRDCMYIVLE